MFAAIWVDYDDTETECGYLGPPALVGDIDAACAA